MLWNLHLYQCAYRHRKLGPKFTFYTQRHAFQYLPLGVDLSEVQRVSLIRVDLHEVPVWHLNSNRGVHGKTICLDGERKWLWLSLHPQNQSEAHKAFTARGERQRQRQPAPENSQHLTCTLFVMAFLQHADGFVPKQQQSHTQLSLKTKCYLRRSRYTS